MPRSPSTALLLPLLLVSRATCQSNFTVSNGQIFTPGFAIVDAPQPGTPLGGSQLEVAIDVTADGILPLDAATDSPSRIHNMTVFLYSYDTGRNLTISNGTVTNATYGPIMQQEPSSTVKHVKWTWPSCLVGNGPPTTVDSDRGAYNVSIRQNFRMNKTDYYTIFDLPILVTNSIDNSTERPDCDSLANPMMTPDQVNEAVANQVGILFAPGDSQVIQVQLNKTANQQGLGAAASLSWEKGTVWMSGLALVMVLML